MKVDTSMRLKVVMAARVKFNDPRIALEENKGVWKLKALTGIWQMEFVGIFPYAKEVSLEYWTGSSFEEAQKAVK